MREISPAVGVSVDDYVKMLPSPARRIVEEIRQQKREGTRKAPSIALIDRASTMTRPLRAKLLDAVAALVAENYAGRSEMCLQFAALLHRALLHLKVPARPVVGTAIYYGPTGGEIWRWRHAWVRIGNEIIDGNVDCLAENPLVPKAVSVAPYWGPIAEVPDDRRLREDRGTALPADVDVDNIWWPELRDWLDTTFVEKGEAQVDQQVQITESRPAADWLYKGQLTEEGLRTAIYPYDRLEEILTPADVRDAVKDETAYLEEELGPETVAPFYDLIWSLNTLAGVFTSHIKIAPAGFRSSSPTAPEYVGGLIILLSRDRDTNHNRSAVTSASEGLLQELSLRAQKYQPNTSGWCIEVGPANVLFTNEMWKTTFQDSSIGESGYRGFGCQLVVGGTGVSRAEAAEHWKAAIRFVADTIRELQTSRTGPAAPHRHLLPRP